MPQSEHKGLSTYIDDVYEATLAGRIAWKAVNPTTFVWETATPKPAKLSLQRVDRIVNTGATVISQGRRVPQQRKETIYLFQVFDLTEAGAATPILNIGGADEADLNQRLQKLFDLVKTGVSERSLEFLRSILPK